LEEGRNILESQWIICESVNFSTCALFYTAVAQLEGRRRLTMT